MLRLHPPTSSAYAETHLVTGATGFVGSALVLELLRSTAAQVVCVVRPREDAETGSQRLQQVLLDVARAFDLPEVGGLIAARCRAVPGDLRLPECGVDPGQIGPISQFWHSAASLRFEEESRAELAEYNVEGTRRALALARRLQAGCFNYVSTAYVAGRRGGLIREELPTRGTPVHNAYEGSKIEAELLVASSGLEYRVLRPSVVIGHSKTHAMLKPNGIYAYARAIAQLQRLLRRQGKLERASELEIRGHPTNRLNLIPIDAVAAAAVRIGQSATRERVFHLTNAEPPPVGLIVSETNALLGLSGPRLTPQPRLDSPLAIELNQRLRFYLDYSAAPLEFDQSHSDALLGREALRWPIDAEGMRRYLRAYLQTRRSSVLA